MDTVKSICNGDQPCPDLLRDELWKHQLHNPVSSFVHGRFMKPLCRALPEGTLIARELPR